ncbi:hypothetical protein FRX31_020773 [Thalictrum thalictroides]|uniref:Uncharacterized protein n=1 Tax=Thalictrum thalictroides TaxID=46969 RepID=A0A7J6VZM5_THATH|nr:hypothetical protein FRX31_020773 [Thalictrum thalictroides]
MEGSKQLSFVSKLVPNVQELAKQPIHTIPPRYVGMIQKALKIDAKEITELVKDGSQSMRMNYYPPCPQPGLLVYPASDK